MVTQAGIGRKFSAYSYWSFNAVGTKLTYNDIAGSGTFVQSYSSSLSVKHFSFSGSYGKSDGTSFLTSTWTDAGDQSGARHHRATDHCVCGQIVFVWRIRVPDPRARSVGQLLQYQERHDSAIRRFPELDRATEYDVTVQSAEALDHRWLPQIAAGFQHFRTAARFVLVVLRGDHAVVQILLRSILRRTHWKAVLIGALVLTLAPVPGVMAKSSKTQPVAVPELELEGGRRLSFERSFWSEPEVKLKRGFWTKIVDVVAGAPDFHALISPYEVAEDSRGRIIVTDPGASGIHIFDFEQQKYKFISRDKDSDGLVTPQCVTVDAADNIYVTDSESGKIFVFDPSGKFQRTIGSLKGGEGYFKRPTGIAVDSAAERIYVTDTLRNQIFVLDMQGNVLQTIGKTGMGNGRVQLSDRTAAAWRQPDRGRCHEFPRAGAGSLGKFPLRHRTDRRGARRNVPPQRHRRRLGRPSLRGGSGPRDGAGVR